MAEERKTRLNGELTASLLIHALDTASLENAPRLPDGQLDVLSLSTTFGSGEGLMSQFEVARRQRDTGVRIEQIRGELSALGDTPTSPTDALQEL